MALALFSMIGLAGGQPSAPTMFPFVMPDKPPAASVVDCSGWLERPAGRNGFIQARDGHFWTGGRRIRFWGANLAFGGNFPTRREAVVLADKLARFGVNLVRLHSLDAVDGRSSLLEVSKSSPPRIGRENLDRMDYLVARLIERGIYVNLNLHVNRAWSTLDGVDDPGPDAKYSKYISLFDPRLLALHQTFALQLLNHVNPYTKNTYASEHGVAAVEITNENSFFYGAYSGKLDNMAPAYAALFDRQFNGWLKQRYVSNAALKQSWQSELPPEQSLDAGTVRRPKFATGAPVTPRKRDYIRFLWETEAAWFKAMRDYLKDRLQVKMPVTGTMVFTMAGAVIQSELMDFTDMHAYWQHPEFATAWKGKWTIGNTPLVEQPTRNTLSWLGSMRTKGKPYTVSEFNAPWPNFFDAEALPLAAAYGARQDWDGIYIFNYNGDGTFGREHVFSMFDIDGHPVKTAQMIAGAAFFARGDMPPAEREMTGTVSVETALDSAAQFSWSQGEAAMAALGWPQTNSVGSRWGLKFTGGNAPPALAQSGAAPPTPGALSPLRWDKGLAVADTTRSVMMAGRAGAAPVVMPQGGVSVRLLPGAWNFGVVSLHSMDPEPGRPLAGSASVLLLACGRTANTGMKWDPDYKSAYGAMGAKPVLTEGVAAEIQMRVPPGTSTNVYALDPGGAPVRELQVRRQNDTAAFTIGPEHRTIWYWVRNTPGARASGFALQDSRRSVP